jgi:hypothetical protein
MLLAAATLGAGPAVAEQLVTWVPVEGNVFATAGPGTITFSFVSKDAAFTNDLVLVQPENAAIFDCAPGAAARTFNYVGGEIIVALTNQDGTFYSGTKSGDSTDGLNHHKAYQNLHDPNEQLGRVEDTLNLGDGDFNDCVFQINANPGEVV